MVTQRVLRGGAGVRASPGTSGWPVVFSLHSGRRVPHLGFVGFTCGCGDVLEVGGSV